MRRVSPDHTNASIRERLELRPVINVSGTMTALGASIMIPEATRAMAEMGTEWVEMDDLQRRASEVIARATGAEAGFVTACCASGISLAVAGAMTGLNLLAVERLPEVMDGLSNEVIIQLGHMVNFGGPIDQTIRLTGARLIPAGMVTGTYDFHVLDAITEKTAAAVYVVSHHTVQYGMLSLEDFCALCHSKGVPVIVDAAGEYDLTGFLKRGADIAVYSGHKFLSGPTSGIVAGKKDLVRAAYLQNRGLGRGMKVGKESIAGVLAALEAWETRDHAEIREREERALALWRDALQGIAGIATTIAPDPTNNPIDRLTVIVGPESGYTATGLAAELGRGTPPIIVRNHELELGHFFLDPCNLHPGEAEIVARRLVEALTAPERPADAMQIPHKSAEAILSWPD